MLKSNEYQLEIKTMKMNNQVVSISSVETDYYVWGRNCAFLGYAENITKKCLQMERDIDSESFDLFWAGYFENINKN